MFDMESSTEIVQIRPQPKQEIMLASPADFSLVGGGAGSGKGGLCYSHDWLSRTYPDYTISMFKQYRHLVPADVLEKDTKVLRWDGKFTSVMDLSVGDRIMNPDGYPQEILQIHDRGVQACYKVTFEDGTSVECDKDHLWGFWEARKDSRRKSAPEGRRQVYDCSTAIGWNFNYISRARVRSTDWLHTAVMQGRRFIIPITAPLHFNAVSNAVSSIAYTIGLLIGDAHFAKGSRIPILTTADTQIRDYVLGTHPDSYIIKPREGKEHIFNIYVKDEQISSWVANNKYAGKLSHDKFLPKRVFTATYGYRLSLAQGLFDSDGYASNGGNNEVSYTTTSKQLAEDVATLVRTLGYMAKIREKQGVCYIEGVGKPTRMAYTVVVEGNDRHKLFRLTRNITNALNIESNIWVGKAIVSIDKIEEATTRCITVSNPNRLYITDGYNVTHNSWVILANVLRWLLSVPNFRGVIFRRTTPQIRAPGSIWDAAVAMYSQFDELVLRETTLSVVNPSINAKLTFAHLEQAKDVLNWQGTELAFIGFDEITHFELSQVLYMMSRNRSTCGVRPYMFATCNPEADHWLQPFVEWYLHNDMTSPLYGTPRAERSGKIRYFARVSGDLVWADSEEALLDKHGRNIKVKTFTFISASIFDNAVLMEKDPGYLANLEALPLVERGRLLGGNWYVRAEAGMFFRKEWFRRIDRKDAPKGMVAVRYWDRAGTEPSTENPDPDWTVGTLIGRHPFDGKFYVLDVVRFRDTPGKVKQMIKTTADEDGVDVVVVLEQDPGQAGKSEIDAYIEYMPSYTIMPYPATKAKAIRARNASSECEAGNINVVNARWTDIFINEAHMFDGKGNVKDDQVDTLSGGVNVLYELCPVGSFEAAVGNERKFTKDTSMFNY